MFTKIMLVIVFITLDGSGYQDIVALFPTKAECESALKTAVANVASSGQAPTDAHYFAACVKPRALSSKDA